MQRRPAFSLHDVFAVVTFWIEQNDTSDSLELSVLGVVDVGALEDGFEEEIIAAKTLNRSNQKWIDILFAVWQIVARLENFAKIFFLKKKLAVRLDR